MFYRRKHRRARAIEPGVIALRDPAVARQVAIIGLSPHDLGVIAAHRGACAAALDGLVDALHDRAERATGAPEIRAPHPRSERRPPLAEHVLAMFEGRVDDAYVAARRHLGAGDDAGGCVDLYEAIRRLLVVAVKASGADAAAQAAFEQALVRLIQLDITLLVATVAAGDEARDLSAA